MWLVTDSNRLVNLDHAYSVRAAPGGDFWSVLAFMTTSDGYEQETLRRFKGEGAQEEAGQFMLWLRQFVQARTPPSAAAIRNLVKIERDSIEADKAEAIYHRERS